MASIEEVLQSIADRAKHQDVEAYAFDHVSDGADGIRLDEASACAVDDYAGRDDTDVYSVLTEKRLSASSIFQDSFQKAVNYVVTRGMVRNKVPPSRYLLQKSLSCIGVDMPESHDEQGGVAIAPDTTIDTILPELISLGDGVQLGTGSTLAAHGNIGTLPVKSGGAYRGSHWRIGPVTIEDYADIGADTVIGPGTSIGAHSQVTTRSILMQKTVPPRTKVSCYKPETEGAYQERPRTVRRVNAEDCTPRINRVTL